MNGQSGELTVRVPFEFTAGTTTLSAGTYLVTRDSVSSTFLSVRNLQQTPLAVLSNTPLPPSGQSNEPTRLVFMRYGQRYFLREVWFMNDAGLTLPVTPQERISAEERPHTASWPTAVSVVASLR